MGTLAGGNMLAQSITLVAYFALTRIFSTEDYGLYSIFYSYIDVLIILSTCKYEIAIVGMSLGVNVIFFFKKSSTKNKKKRINL